MLTGSDARPAELTRSRVLTWLAFVASTIGGGYLAVKSMFIIFAPYDDEGVMLVSLREFALHGGLYDRVYSYYGPLYFQVFGFVFRLTPLTHDKGRLVVAAVWTITPLLLGIAVHRLTGSLAAGIVTQVDSYFGLFGLVGEPMHPSGLICVLLAATVVAMAWLDGRPRARGAAVGALAAAMLLVKVNVGIFAIAAIGLTAAWSDPALRRVPGLRWVAGAVFAAMPLLLVSPLRSDPAELGFGLTVSVGAVLLVGLGLARETVTAGDGLVRWSLVAGGSTVALCIAVALLTGTSLGGLVGGWLIAPLHQTDYLRIDVVMPAHKQVMVALVLLALVVLSLRGPTGQFSALVRIAIGAGLLAARWIPDASLPGTWVLGLLFVWLVAVPALPATDRQLVARRFLAALALSASLQLYPVAGTQVYWSSLLLLPVGAVLVVDGLRAAATAVGLNRAGAQAARLVAGLAAAAIAFGGLRYGNSQVEPGLGAPTLNLPGSHLIHMTADRIAVYEQVTDALRQHGCSTFVSLPGMNSFYLWAQMTPPTGYNDDDWMFLFDDALQRRIVAQVSRIPRLCALVNAGFVALWAQGRPVPQGPFVVFPKKDFQPVLTVGGFSVETRRP